MRVLASGLALLHQIDYGANPFHLLWRHASLAQLLNDILHRLHSHNEVGFKCAQSIALRLPRRCSLASGEPQPKPARRRGRCAMALSGSGTGTITSCQRPAGWAKCAERWVV